MLLGAIAHQRREELEPSGTRDPLDTLRRLDALTAEVASLRAELERVTAAH